MAGSIMKHIIFVFEQKVNPYTHCFQMSKKHLIAWTVKFVFKKIIETGKLSLTELKFISHTLALNFLNMESVYPV
jgi:hypothetical protein